MYKAILTIAFLVMTYEISIALFIAIVKASTYF